MQIEIKVDAAYAEPKILILTDAVTEDITALVQRLSEPQARALTGFWEDGAVILEPEDIERVFAERQKVYAHTCERDYLLKMRLYEVEAVLDPSRFVRISNSEIINLRKVASLDLSLTGTICLSFKGGGSAYVSRRYVAKIKQILGI